MPRILLFAAAVASAFCVILQAQTHIVPKPPFTSQDAERGNQLRARSNKVRAEMTKIGNHGPLPVKITDPPVKVDRAFCDGDLIKVGRLSVTAYLLPGHTPGSTSYAFNAREGNRDYKVFLFCCWEYPDDLWQNVNVSEASVRHILDVF